LVSTGGEQGLLSMAFDPHYAANRRFYVDYTNVSGDTRVVRYRASSSNPDVAVASSARVLLGVHQPYSNHNGGQLQFGPGGLLFVGMGDGGSGGDPQHHAQDPRSRLGKLLRINVGVSPARVTTYAKGLRNPWRFSFDRKTGALWIGDVGQNAWEEIDYLRPGRPAGANLGWNGYEGTHVYDAQVAATLNKASLTRPVAQYSHSIGNAVTGGYVYRGSAIPALRGFYLFADFGSGHAWAMKGPSGARRALSGADGQVSQISSFGQDASGELYIVSLTGSVYKIVPR
jgi:glucose/arabinose dehydrogenase